MIQPTARMSDPATSHLAAKRAERTPFKEVSDAIMQAFTRPYFKEAMTDDEIYRALYTWERERWSDRTVRHGRAALVARGLLKESDEKKRNRRGSLCRAYELVAKG